MCDSVSCDVATQISAVHCPCMLAPTNDRTDLVDESKDLVGEVSGVNKPLLILATAEQSI